MRKTTLILGIASVMLVTLPAAAQASWHVNGAPAPIPGTEYTLMGHTEVHVSTVFDTVCQVTATGDLTTTGFAAANTGFANCTDRENPRCAEEGRLYLTAIPPKSRTPEAYTATIEEREGAKHVEMPGMHLWLVDLCDLVEQEITYPVGVAEGIIEINGTRNALKPSHIEGEDRLGGNPLGEVRLTLHSDLITPIVQLVTWE